MAVGASGSDRDGALEWHICRGVHQRCLIGHESELGARCHRPSRVGEDVHHSWVVKKGSSHTGDVAVGVGADEAHGRAIKDLTSRGQVRGGQVNFIEEAWSLCQMTTSFTYLAAREEHSSGGGVGVGVERDQEDWAVGVEKRLGHREGRGQADSWKRLCGAAGTVGYGRGRVASVVDSVAAIK